MADEPASNSWFDQEEEEKLCEALHAQTEQLEKSPYESDRRESLLFDLELFLGTKLSSLYQLSGASFEGAFADEEQIAFNICYSITNTIRNRICSFRPRAQFLPDGGDHKAQRAARDMTDMSDAWAQKENYQGEASFAMRDSLTGDGGVMKCYAETPPDDYGEDKDKRRANKVPAKICIARFPSWEFLFDAAESVYREPYCGYHVHYLPVELAARTYHIDEMELKKYVVSMPQGIVYVQNREMVRVIDAYARGPKGKHAVVVGPKAFTEAWEWDGHPFIRQFFDERPIGIWADGAVKQLRSLQLEMLEWQKSVSRAHHLTSQLVMQVQESEDAPTKITNDYVRVERYKNQPAVFNNPAAVNGEMYRYFDVLEQAGYKKLGISQFIAAGTKQPGINSAVAIRESSELQTDRLALVSQNWENTRVETAEWWRRFATKLTKDGYNLEYRAVRRGQFLRMEMEQAEREYEIRVFPSSLFGQTISGRLEKATELIKAGFLDQEDAMKALDIPDLSPIVDLKLSRRYAMEHYVDQILEDGKYETPDAQLDPVAFYDYADRRYCLTIADGSEYPEGNRALLRKLLQYLKPKADAAKAAAAVAPAPAGGPAPGPALGGAAEAVPGLTGANGAMAA